MTKKNDWDAIAGRAGPSGPRREGTAAGKAGEPGEDTQGWAKLDNGQKLNMLTSEALDTQRDLLALGVDPDNHKRNSMLKDVAQGIITTQVRVEETTLRGKRDDIVLKVILDRIAEAEEEEARLLSECKRISPPEND